MMKYLESWSGQGGSSSISFVKKHNINNDLNGIRESFVTYICDRVFVLNLIGKSSILDACKDRVSVHHTCYRTIRRTRYALLRWHLLGLLHLLRAVKFSTDLGSNSFLLQISFDHSISFGLDESLVPQVSAVPLPAALPLMMTGLAGLGFAGWRKRKST